MRITIKSLEAVFFYERSGGLGARVDMFWHNALSRHKDHSWRAIPTCQPGSSRNSAVSFVPGERHGLQLLCKLSRKPGM